MADARVWTKRVAGWRASGQTAAVYCERHRLGLSALRYWAHRLGREGVAPQVGSEASVRLARVVTTPAASPGPRPALLLDVRGARITVDVGFDRATLAAVLDVLRAGGAP